MSWLNIGRVVGQAVHRTIEGLNNATKPRPVAPRGSAEPTNAEASVALRHLVRQVTANMPQPLVSFVRDLLSVTPQEQRIIEQEQVRRDAREILDGDKETHEMARELAARLRGRTEEYRAQLFAEVQSSAPGFMVEFLKAAGGEVQSNSLPGLTRAEQKSIAKALGAAYDKGLLPRDFVNNLLVGEAIRNSPSNEATGNLVGMSGSKELVNAYVNKATELACLKDGEELEGHRTPRGLSDFVLGAARAMAGNPRVMRDQLSQMSWGQLRNFMESLSPENRAAFILRRPDNSPVNALAAFIEGAGRVQPPTEGVLNVFKLGARDHIETPGVPEALARVFTAGRSNSQYILNHLTNFDSKSNSSITDDRVQMLTNFFRKTIFSDPASLDSSVLLDPAVKNEIVEESRQFVSSLRAQIENNPNPDVPRMMRLARQAGHVVGALVGAFNETLKDYADEDAAHDRRVGNAVTVASTIAALAGPEAHWAVKGGVKVGSVVLKKFLQGQPPVGERELEQYESLLQNDFDGFDSGLNIPGLPRRFVTDIENELVDGANEALTKWAENEGVLRDPLGN